MKNTLIFLLGLFISVSSLAQTELVVEFKTDAYPEENKWVLYDLDGNKVEESDSLSKETIYMDTITLDDTKCYYWTMYDEYGEGINGPKPGDYKLYLDGTLIAECIDPNFGDSISVYDIGKACMANNTKLHQVELYEYQSKDETVIPVSILNMGSEAISSVKITYAINGGAEYINVIDGLSIQVGELETIYHPDAYAFTAAGDYTINVSVSEVNGVTVSNTINNTVEKTVNVVDGYVKKNIIEDFMSYECGPCWDADVQLKETFSHFPGSHILIKYMAWPFADTKYFPASEDLMDYYRVGGIPHIRFNGEYQSYITFTPTFYSDSLGVASPVKISLTGKVVGDSMGVTAKVVSNVDINSGLILRGTVIEKECVNVSIGNPGNKYPYENVAYGFVNSSESFILDGLTAGVEQIFTASIDLSYYHLEEDTFTDLALVFALKDANSTYIYQSAIQDVDFEQLDLKLTYNVSNGENDVDTTGLVLTAESNRKILNLDGEKIKLIDDHITLRQGSFSGAKVPFVAGFENNKISLTPKYGWEKNTTYCLKLENFSTIDKQLLYSDTLSFTTRAYAVDNEQEIFELVKVYPNPVKDKLSIFAPELATIKIFDLSGKQLQSIKNVSGNVLLNMSEYKEGLYLLEININNTSKVFKLVK